jgi:hypothetical protein
MNGTQTTPLGDALAAAQAEVPSGSLGLDVANGSSAPAVVCASEASANPEVRVIDLATMSDSLLIEDLGELQDEYRTTLAQVLATYVEPLKSLYVPQIAARKEEIERRIKAARETNPAARALPHRGYRVELKPIFGDAIKDVKAAKEAQALLPEDEAKKLVRHVPAEIIPAYDELGNVNSISALKRKYPKDTEVGELLERAYHKPQIGEQLDFEKLPDAQPAIASKAS